MMYKAIAEGLNKRILVPENEVMNKLVELYGEKPNKDFYISVFKYSEKHKEQFNKTGSLAGINDNKSTQIIFDFDDESNIENARKDAITVFDRLVSNGFSPSDIIPAYSGGKGFHLEINTTNEFQREELVNIRQSLSGDLNTTDPVIKDNQRIIRAVLSKHNKTGLYKIPLTANELKTMPLDKIQAEAKNPSDERYAMAGEVFSKTTSTPTSIMKLTKVKPKEVAVKASDEVIDFSKNKTGLTNAKYVLAQGYFEEGERHEAVMILASTYMSLGWPQDLCYNNLKATLRLRNARLGKSVMSEFDKAELWKEVESVYSPLWKGGVYSEDKNELLIRTKKLYKIEDRYDTNLMVNLSQVNGIFSNFAKNIDKNTLKLGIPSFDSEIRVTTGTLVSLLAAPSSGKSSISFGILNSTSKDNIKSMFFSLDMGAPQVYQRLVQRHTGYSSDRIFKAYRDNEVGVIEHVETVLSEEYKNVKFCFRGAMNVDIIRDAIIKEKDLTGEYPKLVVIDYLENVLTDMSNDPTTSKGFVARSLKDMANEFGICILLLTQPAKISGGPSEELNSYYGIKGSGLVAEASAQVITMHRPGFDPKNPADDEYITLTVVKNRMGQLGTFDYHWTGLTGAIRELTHEEQSTLKKIRELNIAKKKGMDDL